VIDILRYLNKSFRSLMLHRLRTLLSTLGVLFGVVAVIAMLSIGEGAKQETLEQIEQLGMNTIIIRQVDLTEDQQQMAREKRSQGLSHADGKALATVIPYIQQYAPVKVVEAMLNSTNTEIVPEILAVTGCYGDIKGATLAEGRQLCDRDIQSQQHVCVLGAEVARTLGKKGHCGQTVRIENTQFQVVGVLEPRHWSPGKSNTVSVRNLNNSVLIPLGSEKSLPQRQGKGETLTELIVQLDHSAHIHQTSSAVRHILAKQHHEVEDYQIIVPQELLQQANRTQQTFNLVLGSIATISLLVGGIGIMNIMLATVSERTREIGIRRAVGANKRHIALQFLCETLLLTLSGAILGILLGICFSLLIGHFAGWKTIVKPWSVLLALGMSSGVGLFSGLYPALKAAAMNPITALRHD
jgi:putative ABC transport system permease protein